MKNITKVVLCWTGCVAVLINGCACDDERPPVCSSEIYCYGRLLDTIQMAKIYEDSKTFVDMKMKYSPNETLQKFDMFMLDFKERKPSRKDVQEFVRKHFESAGQEFEEWLPADWKEHPGFINNIIDEEFKTWAVKLNAIWKTLGRKIKTEIQHHKDLYSIIWVPNPVIVPGGRFREFYYWDTYWIINGLLLSEMHDTVRGILENFLYIVEHYGHIPNGGRVYYMARSQPPLMVPMIKLYHDFTQDDQFIKDNIDTMEKEFNYWMVSHTRVVTLDGKNHTLAVYGDNSSGPRPESYSEDVESGNLFKEQNKKEAYYAELKAAAESGWDFSSRWFVTNATNKGNLTNAKARSIVPVDLNALIYWNAVLLSEFHTLLGNTEKAAYYGKVAVDWMISVTAVLWHEEIGSWLDYDMYNSIKRDYFYPTNIAPLWTGCYNATEKDKIVRSVMKYLQNKNIMYPGGIPTTFEHTGEQWDYPNAWPPLQHIMIVGLNNTGEESAMRLAYEIAETWVRSNHKAFKETDAMYEKYDATVPGGYGGGGEYELQLGFGWTNGIIMDLLNRYAGTMRADDPPPTNPPLPVVQAAAGSNVASITAALVALLVSLSAGFIGVCLYKRRTRYQQLNNERKRPYSARYTELRNIPKHKKSTRFFKNWRFFQKGSG